MIGPGSTIWPQAVLRGDQSRIVMGAQTSVQDGAVLHSPRESRPSWARTARSGTPHTSKGARWRTGRSIGTGSSVLHRAIVPAGALVGAGAVPDGMEVPGGAMALGVPAKLREGAVGPTRSRIPRRSTCATGRATAPSCAGSTEPDVRADRAPDAVRDEHREYRERHNPGHRPALGRTAELRTERAKDRTARPR